MSVAAEANGRRIGNLGGNRKQSKKRKHSDDEEDANAIV